VAELYPRALGSLYVVSYDSQGYGGGILTLPQPGGPGRIYIYPSGTEWSSPKSRYHRRPVSQYVLVPSPLDIKGLDQNEFESNIRTGTLRRNFLSYHWKGCMRSMQCNVGFGYQLSIRSGKTLIELAGRRTFRMQTDF
jgi:hypothetical protein